MPRSPCDRAHDHEVGTRSRPIRESTPRPLPLKHRRADPLRSRLDDAARSTPRSQPAGPPDVRTDLIPPAKGARSGSPVTWAMPPEAQQTRSLPCQEARGPVLSKRGYRRDYELGSLVPRIASQLLQLAGRKILNNQIRARNQLHEQLASRLVLGIDLNAALPRVQAEKRGTGGIWLSIVLRRTAAQRVAVAELDLDRVSADARPTASLRRDRQPRRRAPRRAPPRADETAAATRHVHSPSSQRHHETLWPPLQRRARPRSLLSARPTAPAVRARGLASSKELPLGPRYRRHRCSRAQRESRTLDLVDAHRGTAQRSSQREPLRPHVLASRAREPRRGTHQSARPARDRARLDVAVDSTHRQNDHFSRV